jgi:hypothetical protein
MPLHLEADTAKHHGVAREPMGRRRPVGNVGGIQTEG